METVMIKKSTYYFYTNVPLSRDKNRIVEDIALYLSSPAFSRTGNYFKNLYDTELTIENNPVLYDLASIDLDHVNYLKVVPDITVDDDVTTLNPLYYFIENYVWVSEKAVKFTLHMDVLNTFNGRYTLSDKSHITRKHQNRMDYSVFNFETKDNPDYIFNGSGEADILVTPSTSSYIINVRNVKVHNSTDGSYTIEYTTSFQAVIHLTGYVASQGQNVHLTCTVIGGYGMVDRYSEGLSPTLYRSSSTDIHDTTGANWYLAYRNQNAYDPDNPETFKNANPVECLLIPDQTTKIDYASHDILPGSLTSTYLYKVSLGNNSGNAFSVFADDELLYNIDEKDSKWIWFKDVRYWVYFWEAASKINIALVKEYTDFNDDTASRTAEIKTGISAIKFSKQNQNLYAEQIDTTGWTEEDKEDYYGDPTCTYPTTHNKTFSTSVATGALYGIDFLDRTDARLIKLIALPYCPVRIYRPNEFKIVCPSGWTYSQTNHFLTLSDLNIVDFKNSFEAEDEEENYIPNPENVLKALPKGITGTEARQQTNGIDDYEFKLFHSDFYQPKIVYDSFGLSFALEQVNPSYQRNKLSVEFYTTKTVNSKFLFRFDDYIESLKYTNEDYPGIIAVGRNNESVLFNSQYINYLRTGYNYDIKNKERQQLAAGLGIVGNAASIGTSIAGNPLGAIMGATGMVSTISSMIQAEESIEQKLLNARLQAVTVSGSDDIDLLEAYSGNKAKLCTYECSPRVKKQLSDLFYYYGYIDDEYGTPDTNTRWWFDYVQGDVVLVPSKNMTREMEYAIRQSYADGVTIFHNRNNTWNLAQDKENWERNLV